MTTRLLRHTLLTYTLLMTGTLSSCAKELVLVSDHNSGYVIVLPATANATEQKAAAVLQQYIKMASGAVLKVQTGTAQQKAIYINAPESNAAATLKYDGYSITASGDDIYLQGKSGKGVLYAAYAFAEEVLHCKKYDAGTAEVPLQANITLPSGIDIRNSPSFSYRESFYPMSQDQEYLDWHRLHRFEDLWGLWGHSYFKLVPPDQYFKPHPEYFALVNGSRKATQLCLSNASVLGIVIDQLRSRMADNPYALYWSVGPNDESGYCTCTACATADQEEGGPQGSLIRFVNKVAAAFPSSNITTLGYGYTAHAPLKTRPAPNVFIFVSSIDAYREQALTLAPSAAVFRKDLKGWAAVTANIFVWDYCTQFTNYLTPFPVTDHIQADYQYLLDNHVKGIFEQGSGYTYGDVAELNSYVQSVLLWNPSADYKLMQDSFCKGYYGKAAPAVQEYLIKRSEALIRSGRHLDIYGNPVTELKGYLSPGLIDGYDQLLDKAETMVAGTRFESRVQRLRLGLDYVVLQQSRHFGADQYGFLQDNGSALYKVKPEWIKKVTYFVAAAKKAGVTELSEGGLNPDQYLTEWQDLFSRQWPVNIARNASLQLRYPFAEDYPAKGLHTLTDGMTGFSDYAYNWLCFYGTDMIATLDLKKAETFGNIKLRFLDDPRHYIFVPEDVFIETSTDGITYKPYSSSKRYYRTEHSDNRILTVLFGAKATARFIRVTARNSEGMPAWEPSTSKKPMIACDEIMVLP